jgi:hypothetical protein
MPAEVHNAIATKDAVALDADSRRGVGKFGRTVPMRCRTPAVEQACRSTDEGARADTGGPPGAGGGATDVGQGFGALEAGGVSSPAL